MRRFIEDSDLAICFRDLETLESVDGPIQQIDLLRHPTLGKMLVINGELQHVENWSAFYHEPLVHISAAFVTNIRQVLILGGGSLFAAAEILLYPTVEKCTLVDHDPLVLELVAKHYPHAKRVLESAKFCFVERDAMQFMSNRDETYDLLLNDCFDSVSVQPAHEASTFDLMSACIEPDGVCADVVYRHIFERSYRARTRIALESRRPYSLSLITVPEYPGVFHFLACWGNSYVSQGLRRPRNAVQRSWLRGRQRPTLQFYDPEFLRFYLYLPPYLERMWHASADEGSTEAKIG